MNKLILILWSGLLTAVSVALLIQFPRPIETIWENLLEVSLWILSISGAFFFVNFCFADPKDLKDFN